MIGGYYICEGILFGNWIVPLASIPGNIVQIVVGIAIAIPVCVNVKKFQLLNKLTTN